MHQLTVHEVIAIADNSQHRRRSWLRVDGETAKLLWMGRIKRTHFLALHDLQLATFMNRVRHLR